MRLFLSVGLASLLLAGNVNAYNVVIDFEELPLDGDFVQNPGPIVTSGFSFDSLVPYGITDWPLATDDSRVLHWFPYPGPGDVGMNMAQDYLAPFDVVSLDLGFLEGFTATVDLQGEYAGGGTISTSIVVTDVMTTFNLGAGWENLEYFSIASRITPAQAIAVDNIVLVTAVPVPAAVWLFGSALTGLAWLRRR